ncbi:MAG: M48 family metallopeptidase [Sulfuriflexus sp.]|nr:M48 family metallopeptidase [Sulfuriflexus sp.]
MTDYSIKISPRAKHVSLKITPAEGLVVVVPRGFKNHDLLDELVESRSAWIKKVFSRYAEEPSLQTDAELPESIQLPALDEDWAIDYIQTNARSVRAVETASLRLQIMGNIEDSDACAKALRRWLMRRAKENLLPLLEQASEDCGLSFSKATIRGQRTRWGSCSSTGSINLNYQLMFVRPEMMNYVLVHELCHTAYLNHSASFYKLLESYIPDYRHHETQLKQAWRSMPAWLYRLQAA